ncbi:MAG: mandelate racemase/muconate lactonizing enzyme family protein [Caldilineaceae bacterium]|nr:mandelate racemase/muconate lactonizing enzyme family protein [Caldilineaceae bacterium]
MKITGVETYLLQYELGRAIGPSTMLYPYRTTLLVKISTDEGLVGWGETAPIGAAQAVIQQQLGPTLLGQNPLEHRRLWRQLWGANFGNPLAVAALDLALHDLRGKALNLSVAELYGGRLRDQVPVYGSAMNYTEGVAAEEQYPAEAAALVERGFRALKMRVGGQPLPRDVAAATAVREAVGPDILLMADGNGAYSLAKAIKMGRALEELDFYWFEEPLPQPDYAAYEILADKLDIAIAAGEALGSRGAFKEVLSRHAMDIIQPDVSLCGGFAECLFIAEMGRLWGVPTMPHCWGGAVVVAATLQFLSLLPDASWARTTEIPMLELDTYENPFRDRLVTTPAQVTAGMVAVPTGPGLGIEIVEEVITQYRIG